MLSAADDQADNGEEEEEEEEEGSMEPPVKRQTLIFSATLVMPEELRKTKGKKAKAKQGKGSIMAKIMRKVGIRGRPAIVDLTSMASTSTKGGEGDQAPASQSGVKQRGGGGALRLPEGLRLSYVKTLPLEKDLYTYYFLRHYPGRTLIFTNSIDNVQRMARLLSVSCRILACIPIEEQLFNYVFVFCVHYNRH